MPTTDELQATVSRIADRVVPAVVRIGRHGGRGCGVVVGEGLVLTNAHNLHDRTTLVTFADGRAVQSRATGVDADTDLVVLGVDTGGTTPPCPGPTPPSSWARRSSPWPASPRATASPSEPCPRPTARSGDPGGAWLPAASSTPPPWPG